MNLKKRLFLLVIAVIFIVSFYVNNRDLPVAVPTEVEGWGRNVSKDVRDYISETLPPHIMPKNFCQEKGLLLAIVNSKLEKFDAREAVRESWGQKLMNVFTVFILFKISNFYISGPNFTFLGNNVTFYFLVGEDKTGNHEVQVKLKHEGEKYNDIIQERFIDSYNNLTLKSISMLKLFHLHCSSSYKYLMKIDDDIFLNIENILEFLRNRSITTDLLVGQLYNDTKPFRDPTSKWFVPYELYSDEKYPLYLCGATYLMSTDVAEKLYQCALETPIFFIEDVYITGICAKKVNVTPQHNTKFNCIYLKKYICIHKEMYTLHFYEPEEIRESYSILKEGSCPVPGSWLEWFYILWW